MEAIPLLRWFGEGTEDVGFIKYTIDSSEYRQNRLLPNLFPTFEIFSLATLLIHNLPGIHP